MLLTLLERCHSPSGDRQTGTTSHLNSFSIFKFSSRWPWGIFNAVAQQHRMLHCNSASVSLCNRSGGIEQESMWLQLLLLLLLLLMLPVLSLEFSWRSSDSVTDVDMWMTDWWIAGWMFDTRVGGSMGKRWRWGKGGCGRGERLSESVISSLCTSRINSLSTSLVFLALSVCKGLPLIYKWSYSPPPPPPPPPPPQVFYIFQ